MIITDTKLADEYYQALLQREPSYVGSFFVGVKTTSIFCIATCRARKPKRQNVVFYTQIKDALDSGYRPCKVCRPTENAHQTPEEVALAIDLVRNSEKAKITDQNLRDHNIRPIYVRRWFKQHYGITFQTFQRMYRINLAYQELKSGKSATHTALDTGYESLSGFGYTFKKLLGHSPKDNSENRVILIDRLTTPIGPMFVCATEQGVCLLEFVDRRMLETEFEDLQKRLKAKIVSGENQHIKQMKHELEEYFLGTRTTFTVPLDYPGTDFQRQVWEALSDIPFGKTASYQEQADHIKNPKAVRAVARANGMNRIAIVIPCHRVIGKDGSLTGYAGGLERKRWLLDHEKKHASRS